MAFDYITKRLQILRVRLPLALFPCIGIRIVGNRKEFVFRDQKVECRFVVKDRTRPDGISWEEMIDILDVFLGRHATDQEWRQILAWKNPTSQEAA